MSLYPNQILRQRYQIHSLLGQGGFGAVYRAQDLNLNRWCAVKENLDSSLAAQQQFQREAMMLSRLHHTNLPQVQDYFIEPSGQQYLVMEFIEGIDVWTLVQQRGALPETQVLDWARQILDALEYLHGQQPPIIHRDIKPQNIIITPHARAMVVDFGIAKTYVSEQITTTGARGVTPGFSPPEQYGGGTDPRSDLYALGATLYLALTRAMPPESPTLMVGQAVLISPRQLAPTISANTEAVVVCAMQPQPAQRFQSAREMRMALTTMAYSMPRPTVPVPYVAAPARQTPWIFAAIGGSVASLLLVGVLVFALFASGFPFATPTPIVTVRSASGLPTSIANIPVVVTSTNIPHTATWTPTVMPTELPPTGMATPTAAPTFTATPTPMSREVFLDDFDGGAIDSSKWNVNSRAGRVGLGQSVLTLASSGASYPFITTRVDPFPGNGNYRMTTRFRYSHVDVCGVGMMTTSYALSAGMSQDDAGAYQHANENSGMAAGVWQDIKQGLQIWFRSRGDRKDVLYSGPDTDWHVIAVEYVGDRYTLFLDDRLSYVSQPTPYRARFMWIGNPVELGAGFNCPWDTLDVDHVRVESLP